MLLLVLLLASVPARTLGKFITYQDYDFLGEDEKLAAALRSRMPVVNISEDEVELSYSTPQPSVHTPIIPRRYADLVSENKPELVESKRFDVSLDYGDLPNITSADDAALASALGALAPPPGADSALGALAPPPGADSALGALAPPPGADSGRRLHVDRYLYDSPPKVLCERIMQIMKQDVYAVQGRLVEVEPLVLKYKDDIRFRIAYIYNKILEWQKQMKNLGYMIANKHKPYEKKFSWLQDFTFFKHMVRKNIDITYSIEYLIYLHNQFMKGVTSIISRDELREISEMRKLKKQADSLSPQDRQKLGEVMKGRDWDSLTKQQKEKALVDLGMPKSKIPK